MSPSLDRTAGAEIAIVGLGEIGGGIARFLAGAGLRVIGFDIDEGARKRASAGGVAIAASLAEAVDSAPIVATSLPSEAAVLGTYLGPGALADAGGRIVTCDLSTLPPATVRRIAEARAGRGGAHVEGAVIGVGRDAERGELYLMFAGAPEHVEALAPLLRASGRGHARFGTPGHAALAKILNNGVGQATLAAAAEALALARAAGLSPETLVRAMLDGRGAGHSVVLERHGMAMAADADGPGTAALVLKDMEALAAVLAGLDNPPPVLARTAETVSDAIVREGCERQGVALARLAWKRLAGEGART